MKSAPFIVLALPRSRTYWLSRFLTYGEWTCGHDEARHVRGMNDVKSWLGQDLVGTVETGASPFWRLIRQIRRDTRIVVVRRPVSEVVDSLLKAGFPASPDLLTSVMTKLDRNLDQVSKRLKGVLSVRYDELSSEQVCARIFQFCLPYKHDAAWWKSLNDQNLQINLAALTRYMEAFAPQLRLAQSLAAQECKTIIWANRAKRDFDGMSIQEEPFDTFYRDGRSLFAQHLTDVGEESTNWSEKNIRLMRRLDSIGSLQVMTARCNGRMFGYLMTVLGPSLESTDIRTATQTTFYGSPDAPGLGLKLQRASIEALKQRGGNWDVVMRAGVRGTGPRMTALYRRMGAEDFGTLSRLALRSA